MTFYSPLRYPGGKSRLSKYIKFLLNANDLTLVKYVEPYAGGASVALSLLLNGYVSEIFINDINKSIYSLWYSVVNFPEELCSLIEDADISIHEWEKQKKIQGEYLNVSLLELGYSTLFLNRTNRSGILQGGVIGGIQQKGNYKIDARFNKKELITRISRIAKFKDKITISCLNAVDLINDLKEKLPANAFFYLDPPYYKKGKGLYQNFYNHLDHLEVARIINSVKQNWLITYDNVEAIVNMYEGYRSKTYELQYSAQKKYVGSEIMFFSNKLKIPNIENPLIIN